MKMKKYLMTGIAALALCVGFTSCSHDLEQLSQEEIDELNAKKIVDNYNKAFIATFGQPAADQNWGFGPSATRTRSGNTGETYAATHQYTSDGQAFGEGETVSGTVVAGANMNHNEWADPDKTYGGWVVPDPLTEAQKALVARYFQTVDDMSYEDPHLRHFFVQQVYKGGSTEVYNTTEGIIAASDSPYDSNNMNLLTVGQYNSHINDFNAGTCSESNVLDNGQHVDGTSHTDQITLMVNVDDTSCFGYHETGSSTHHNDKAALVSWQTIRTWAREQGIYTEDILNDGWDRSFLGFDLAIKEGAQAYATDDAGNVLYATYDQAPTSPVYGWDGEKIVEMGTFSTYQPDPNNPYWIEKRFEGYKDEYKTIMNIGWLTTNENFYVAADKVVLTGEKDAPNKTLADLSTNEYKDVLVFKDFPVEGAQNNKAHVLNLKKIKDLIDDGYLPVKDKSLQEWVQVGTSDGYYSDWIVTLTEAKRQDTPPTPPTPPPFTAQLRIMAEDLSATDKSDYDFNDIVFDVQFSTATTRAKILVRAAGGTLPLRIKVGAEADHDDDIATGRGWQEVHALWNKSTGIMINTNADERVNSSIGWDADYDLDPIELDYAVADEVAAKGIIIEVLKSGQWLPMNAEVGMPAAKFACTPDHDWAEERQSLSGSYTNFEEWVQGKIGYWEWTNF